MSGQATGWVLRHGPKDRAKRAVLLTIADAANRDGEHAHPGLAAIVDGSLYGRSTVLAKIRELVEEGWLAVEEEGRGRGHATVYRVLMETSDPRTLSEEKRSDPEQEKVRNSEPAPLTPTVKPNGTDSSETPSPSKPKKPRARNLVWDAICEVVGWEPKTDREVGRVARAQKAIRAAVPADADDATIAMAIRGRARRYREAWPGKELSPDSLVNHWSRFGPKAGTTEAQERTRAERQADPAMTTDAWAEQSLTDEERAESKRRIAWHAWTRARAEERGAPWEATDPPPGWEAPQKATNSTESADPGSGGESAA